MIVVGLDLSLTSTGVAWLDGHTHGCDLIKTDKDPDDLMDGRRLEKIKDRLWCLTRTAELVVVEDLPYSAHGAAKTAKVHAIVGWMLARDRTPYRLVPPSSVKMFALGKGVGSKTAMTLAAARRLGYEGSDDNEADALWLAHLGAHLLGRPVVDLPATHLRALNKLAAA